MAIIFIFILGADIFYTTTFSIQRISCECSKETIIISLSKWKVHWCLENVYFLFLKYGYSVIIYIENLIMLL